MLIAHPPHAFSIVFWATVCETVRPMLSDRCPVCLPCLSGCLSGCDVGVLWPNGWMDQDATWHRGRPRPRRHWGPSSPHGKGHSSPLLSAHVYYGTAKRSPILAILLSSCLVLLDRTSKIRQSIMFWLQPQNFMRNVQPFTVSHK